MTASEIITIIKDIVLMIAAGIASYVALVGLRTWRKQLTGTREYELAQKVLKSTYALRETINQFRRPIKLSEEELAEVKEHGILLTEVRNAELIDNPLAALKELESPADVAKKRLRVEDALTDFEVVIIEAETLWGKEVKELLDIIHSSAVWLRASYIRYLSELDGSLEYLKGSPNYYYKQTFGTWGEEDDFDRSFNTQIKYLEDYLRLYLQK